MVRAFFNMKIVQAGIGGMGNAWLRAARAVDGIEYVGFVEIAPPVIEAQVEAYGLDPDTIFPTLERALDSVACDGVVIVTPPRFHKEMSLEAMRRGIPVLSEKPLADSLEVIRDLRPEALA